MTTFSEYGLDATILSSLIELGYERPTEIQHQTLPVILAGRDCVALAETGSGKTAACAIPICSRIQMGSPGIQALVMVPTRELALQYAVEAQKIGKQKGIKTFALYGGEDLGVQQAKLRSGVHFLVATPGRLIDLVYQHILDLSHIHTLVLDEADQMLSLGFYDDLVFIMDCLVQPHQTLLFSATMPPRILALSQKHMQDPVEIRLIQSKPAPKNLLHYFVFCPHHRDKLDHLKRILSSEPIGQCILFANARHEVERMHQTLKHQFYPMDFLHGGLGQGIRSSLIQKVIKGKIRFLVATDIAARGLDFSGLSHVINLHLPQDQETYLHRAGRTARFGNSGVCITLVTPRDLSALKQLIEHLQQPVHWIGKPAPGFGSSEKPLSIVESPSQPIRRKPRDSQSVRPRKYRSGASTLKPDESPKGPQEIQEE